MKLPAKIVLGLLPLFLTACFHRTQKAQVQPLAPPVQDNPPPPPSTASVNLPQPVASIPPEPTATAPTLPPKPPPKHRKKNNPPASTTNPATTQEAANPAPAPAVSAIGQLSSGDPANVRTETEDSLASIEHGLNTIARPLSDAEQKTADHIRDFLKQAKAALSTGDVDGARTLAAKARILLDELKS